MTAPATGREDVRDLPAGQLAELLREAVQDDHDGHRAAVHILTSYNRGDLLNLPQVRRHLFGKGGSVYIQWRDLATETAGLAAESEAGHVVDVACSLADERPVTLGRVVAAFDRTNRRVLLDAVAIAVGIDPAGVSTAAYRIGLLSVHLTASHGVSPDEPDPVQRAISMLDDYRDRIDVQHEPLAYRLYRDQARAIGLDEQAAAQAWYGHQVDRLVWLQRAAAVLGKDRD